MPQGAGNYATGIWTSATSLISATLAGQIASRQVLRYASYAYDSESGLYYLSARYYDPATRQFTTADSAKADGEESVYQYCGGEPVGKVDPSGTAWHSRIFTCSTRVNNSAHLVDGYFDVYVSWYWSGYQVSGVSMKSGALHVSGGTDSSRGSWARWEYAFYDYSFRLGRWGWMPEGAYGSFGKEWKTNTALSIDIGLYTGKLWNDIYIFHDTAWCDPHSSEVQMSDPAWQNVATSHLTG